MERHSVVRLKRQLINNHSLVKLSALCLDLDWTHLRSLLTVLANIQIHRLTSVSMVTTAEARMNLCQENGSDSNWRTDH